MTAQAILISDPDHALPVEVNRNGLRTVAFGTGEFDRLELPFLPNNADIRAGDLLVTSGLGGTFPSGYPVAIVANGTRIPQDPFADVTATPAPAPAKARAIPLPMPRPAPVIKIFCPLTSNMGWLMVSSTHVLERVFVMGHYSADLSEGV